MITYKYMYAETADKESLLETVAGFFNTIPFKVTDNIYHWSYSDKYRNKTHFYLNFPNDKYEMIQWIRQDIHECAIHYYQEERDAKEKGLSKSEKLAFHPCVQFNVCRTGYGITKDEIKATAEETGALDLNFEFYMDWGRVI